MMNNNLIIPSFDDEQEDSLNFILIKYDAIPNGLIVQLEGYIDTYNSNFLSKKIQKIFDAGYINIIFNCALLNYISSTGIGIFTSFLKIVKSKNGNIILTNLTSKVYEVFQLLGFSQFFSIKDSIEDAISLLNNKDVDQAIFPILFNCPICAKQLKTTRAGCFRCAACKTIIIIDNFGKVFLG